MLPCAAATIPALLADPDWKKRHAALVALAQIAEGCVKGMMKDVAGAVTTLNPKFETLNPKPLTLNPKP